MGRDASGTGAAWYKLETYEVLNRTWTDLTLKNYGLMIG